MNKEQTTDIEADLSARENNQTDIVSEEKTATPKVAEIKGYFLLDNKQPDVAPEQLLSTPPKGKRYAEVFRDDIICIQMEYTKHAKKIMEALDNNDIAYVAMATRTYLRLFFKGDFGKSVHFGYIMTGTEVEMCGMNGYIEHTDGTWKTIHEDTELSEIPLWLYPVLDISALRTKTTMLGEGEWIKYLMPIYERLKGHTSRQRKLAYTVTLKSAMILNEFRLKPFEKLRMESFLNEMEFTKPDFYETTVDNRGREKTIFLKDKFAEWYIERYKLINLDYLPYVYSNGIYRFMPDEEIERLLMKYLPNTNESAKREVRKSICSLLGAYANRTSSKMDQAFDVEKSAPPNLIAFNNGILNIEDGTMQEFSEEIHITNRIPFDYVDFASVLASGEKPEAVKIIDYWLDSFTEYNHEKRLVLEEVAGLCMYKKNSGLRRHNTIIVGPAQSGKSVFISMLTKLIGEENTSYCSIEEICNLNNRFSVINMVDKILNISADVSKRGIYEASRLKNLTTGDKIYVEQKGQPMFEMSFYGKMVFGANELPIISDDAIPSRFEFIEASADFKSTGNKCIPDLYDKYLTREECMMYFVYLAVEGLKRFIKNNYRHTYCAENEALRRNYERVSNPAKAFVESRSEDSWLGIDINEVYEIYMDFIVKELKLPEQDCNSVTSNSFTRAVKRLGYDTKRITIQGQKHTVYINPKSKR